MGKNREQGGIHTSLSREGLLSALESEKDNPQRLTFVLEDLGEEGEEGVLEVLFPYLKHEVPIVREGAMYGIEAFFFRWEMAHGKHPEEENFIKVLKKMTKKRYEPSEGVRIAAEDVLGLFLPFRNENND